MIRLLLALLLIVPPLIGAATVTAPTATVYEDGSYVLTDRTTGCLPAHLCDEVTR